MFACIYVPNFVVSAVLRAAPELKSRAVAIFEGKPPLERIVAASPKAGQMGITRGMIKAQAELCPQLVLYQRSSLQESCAHAALLDCAQSFSPCVEDAARDTTLIDLAGMESLFGTLPEIAHAISNRAASLGLEVNIATAANPDAALLAARGLQGVTVIPAGQEAAQLGALPLEVLFRDCLENGAADRNEAAIRLLETFDRWGIRNLHALAALPEVALSERLGQEGLRLRQLARGVVTRTLVPVEEPLIFEEAIELEHPITLLEPLAFLLNRLLEQLCARLGSRALAAQELRLNLELESASRFRQAAKINHQLLQAEIEDRKSTLFSRTLRLPLPMLDAKTFLKLLQLDLNANPPGAPIVGIHLVAEPARPRSAQGGLFLPPSPEPEKLELTLARIAGMVGENKVGALEMLDTHHPEGFRMQRFTTVNSRKTLREGAATDDPGGAKDAAPVITLRRLRPPLRVSVTLENGEPAYIDGSKKGIQGDVLWKAGPWRFSGDWWEHEAWSRDEWDIALEANAPQNRRVPKSETLALFRLVHDLLGGNWFLEGTYD